MPMVFFGLCAWTSPWLQNQNQSQSLVLVSQKRDGLLAYSSNLTLIFAPNVALYLPTTGSIAFISFLVFRCLFDTSTAGVGPMTVAMLLKNTITLAERSVEPVWAGIKKSLTGETMKWIWVKLARAKPIWQIIFFFKLIIFLLIFHTQIYPRTFGSALNLPPYLLYSLMLT